MNWVNFSPLGCSCQNDEKKSMNTGHMWPWQGHREVGHKLWAKFFFRGSHVNAQTHVGSHEQNFVSHLQSFLSCFFFFVKPSNLLASSRLPYSSHLAKQCTWGIQLLSEVVWPQPAPSDLESATTSSGNVLLTWFFKVPNQGPCCDVGAKCGFCLIGA